jgi:cytochrome c biogenesis factor
MAVSGTLLALLTGLGSLAALPKRRGFVLKLLACCAIGLICFGLAFNLSGKKFLIGLACGIAGFSFIAVLFRMWSGLRIAGKIGAGIAHMGLLVIVVAAGFSSHEEMIKAPLGIQDEITIGGYSVTCRSLERKSTGGVAMIGPAVYVGTEESVRMKIPGMRLWPHNSLYPDGTSTSEVAVYTTLWKDIYITFGGVVKNEEMLLMVKEKPMMFWLWSGAVLVIIGSALGFLRAKEASDEG